MSVIVCFKVLVFEPKTTIPPITAAIAPIRTVGSSPTTPMIVAKIKIPPAARATFEIRMIFRHLSINVGELLNVGFDVQDLFVQVTVVIHLKSTLPRQINDQRRQREDRSRELDRGHHSRRPRKRASPVAIARVVVVNSALRRRYPVACALQVGNGVLPWPRPRAFPAPSLRRAPREDRCLELLCGRHLATPIPRQSNIFSAASRAESR
jgi:hypothetical protein